VYTYRCETPKAEQSRGTSAGFTEAWGVYDPPESGMYVRTVPSHDDARRMFVCAASEKWENEREEIPSEGGEGIGEGYPSVMLRLGKRRRGSRNGEVEIDKVGGGRGAGSP